MYTTRSNRDDRPRDRAFHVFISQGSQWTKGCACMRIAGIQGVACIAEHEFLWSTHTHTPYIPHTAVARWDIISACCTKKARETDSNRDTHIGRGLKYFISVYILGRGPVWRLPMCVRAYILIRTHISKFFYFFIIATKKGRV